MDASPEADTEIRFDRGHALDVLRVWSSARALALIVTPSTSPDLHGRSELFAFAITTTLMYASPEQRDEHPPFAVLPTFDEMAAWTRANRVPADLAFVDPWHTYEDSVGAIQLAIELVAEGGGYVIVHDCDPPTKSSAGPPDDWWKVFWCGQTWRAFVDVASSLPSDHDWLLIDADLGIGVIEVPAAGRRVQRPGRWRDRGPAADRPAMVPSVPVHANDDEAWEWYTANRADVMRLTSPAEFCARFTRAADPG